ncbi:cellulose synthase [Erwinia typographi]|uniref:Cyclic di-GMP-binding protein n=1 Tax=Erwinia typographi TaxID=371042 RepID=A0A0A3Z8B0_9GAMM|nr:cellulose biosynthesis cyclic di-GMP-binding regulatory protein BcsB [Erwinia typographi]KGT95075.1 cellulose synthase [Erwinia typographi]
MKRLILSALCFTGVLTLSSVWAAPESVTQDSRALSQIPPPADVGQPAAASTGGEAPQDYSASMNQATSNASAASAATSGQNGDPAVQAEQSSPAQPAAEAPTGQPEGLPPLPAPVSPQATSSVMLNQPLTSTVSVAQMGQTRGIVLTGGQLQSGIVFTLPTDEVITNARLNLSLKVSQALAARNTSLQLMLNGQPLGTLPLGASDSASEDYQLDIPAAMVVSSNNLSFKINDADQLLCERDSASQYQVTILPKTTLSLEGQQLNMGNMLRNFPRPFIDPLRMTPSVVPMVFGTSVSPGEVSAAAILSSWLGIQTDYRGISFPVLRNDLPEKNGIVFAHPGEMVAGVAIPKVNGPTVQIIDNPVNPVYKLMLVIGKDDDELRQAAWRLTQPLSVDASSLAVAGQSIPLRKPYDAPRWINTDRPVRLSDLLRKDQSMTTTGIWHDALRVNFRAAPDLFLWDGETLPVQLDYRFPSENWIDENESYLNVGLNGTFLRNLTVNKVGLLESIWHRLGGDARQESYTLKLDPYLIYGDNQLQLYFNIKPKENAPCSVLTNNNIKSRIEDNSFIDLSHTRHFTLLPNLAYFVGASFPFTRLADYSQTVLMLPSSPSNAEIGTLLDMAGRSGNATGVALSHNSVMFGIPAGGTALGRLQHSDVLAVSTLKQTAFNQSMLRGSPYDVSGHTLGVREPTLLDNLRGWLTGDWYRQAVDADRYFSSNEDWRGFISYGSPWNDSRVVVMTVATDDDQLSRLHQDLTLQRINAGIRGDTAIITDENGIRSFRVGAQFPSGQMPWYMMVVWYANQHAVVLALLALLFSVLVGLSTVVLLKRHAWKRLNPQHDSSPGEKK